MSNPTRLATLSKDVARTFARASKASRRATVLLACERAVKAAQLTAPEALEVLASLRGESKLAAGGRKRILRLVEQLDEAYFDLSERSGKAAAAKSAAAFRKARAAAALGYALGKDEALHEALYEAAHVHDSDPPAFLLALIAT